MPWVDPNAHGWLKQPGGEAGWDSLLAEYGGAYPNPLAQIFNVVRAGGCRSVVIENRYVDVDYRSEYSAFWSRKFENIPAFALRFHFFEANLEEDGLHRLSEADGYLGYSVIRPVAHGRVGRTVLKRPPELAAATLTSVSETVSLFGCQLTVEGVPFCQQDIEYLRCAQAAAWICHYVSHRKGLVGRASTAAIVDATPSVLSQDRPLPSPGMNLNQLQAVFGDLGQPALLYSLSNMPKVRGVPDPEPKLDGKKRPLPPGRWDKRIFSVICRYLNSGFPVLIAGQGHAFVLVGWMRDGERVKFVACDDQIGPYEVINDPFEHYRAPWEHMMIPLPPKVFLSGESAESRAFQDFRAVAATSQGLGPMADALSQGQLQLRSILKKGRDFKDRVSDHIVSDDVLRALRFARLPNWVWMVEAHDVSLCRSGKPCVFAAALYDPTSFDLSPRLDVLSVPGGVGVYPPDQGVPVLREGGAAPWSTMLMAH